MGSSAPLLRGRKQASGANTVGARSGRRHGQAKGLGGAPALAAEPAIEGLPAARAAHTAARDRVACVHRAIIPRWRPARRESLRRVSSPDVVKVYLVTSLMIRLAAEKARDLPGACVLEVAQLLAEIGRAHV